MDSEFMGLNHTHIEILNRLGDKETHFIDAHLLGVESTMRSEVNIAEARDYLESGEFTSFVLEHGLWGGHKITDKGIAALDSFVKWSKSIHQVEPGKSMELTGFDVETLQLILGGANRLDVLMSELSETSILSYQGTLRHVHDLDDAGYIDTTPNGDVSLTELGREAIRKDREDLLRDSDPDFDVEDDDLLEDDGVTIDPDSMALDLDPDFAADQRTPVEVASLELKVGEISIFTHAVITFVAAQIKPGTTWDMMHEYAMVRQAISLAGSTFASVADHYKKLKLKEADND